MKERLRVLYKSIKNEYVEAVELLLEEIGRPLPELFLNAAEATKNPAVAYAASSHWTVVGGFDEEFLSPMMTMVKKGFVRATENIASVMTEENKHDFTDQDEWGLTVIDWADVMGETELAGYLQECLSKLSG